MNGFSIKSLLILLAFLSPTMLSAGKEPLTPGRGGGPAISEEQPLVQGIPEKFPGGSTNSLTYGGKICFQSFRDSNWEIYTMHANGSSQTRLTNNSADDWTCRWSPDGKQIAFASTRDGSKEQIYIMNANGSQQKRITDNTYNDIYPNWSPDGSKIVFASDRDGDEEIYVMNRDGSGVTQLTFNTSDDSHPSWSPDGAYIAFSSHRDGDDEIYKMKIDGSSQTRLTHIAVPDWYPNWSPDSGWIAFYEFPEIWKMKPNGASLTQLTIPPGNNWSPVYSYDGKYIAFSTNRDTNEEVYAMNADGSGQNNLTNDPSNDRYPHWNAFYWLHLPVVLRE